MKRRLFGQPLASTARLLLALAAAVTASSTVFASDGCSTFRGGVNSEMKGQEGGSRAGHGFDKGDKLSVSIHQSPAQMKVTANLVEYANPDGPLREVVKDTPDSFTYTVPKQTTDFIYLNFSGALPGTFVTWECTPAAGGSE